MNARQKRVLGAVDAELDANEVQKLIKEETQNIHSQCAELGDDILNELIDVMEQKIKQQQIRLFLEDLVHLVNGSHLNHCRVFTQGDLRKKVEMICSLIMSTGLQIEKIVQYYAKFRQAISKRKKLN